MGHLNGHLEEEEEEAEGAKGEEDDLLIPTLKVGSF